ncbi:response regulator transcription factor [Paenibacillus sp. NPDC058174]|uniref:response regulator transcription factor n=1 Tax=Paenibacillus sp. NPDC058174 TaxID=3346366 RepID=UPI0036DC571E
MRPKIIFVIEDDPDVQSIVTSFLQHEGYTVRNALSAAEAFHLFAAEEPDLTILDIQLPDMDGVTFCRHIRTHYRRPILFVTGNREQEYKVNALLSGGDDFIQKPFDPLDLLLRVKGNLRWSDLLPPAASIPEPDRDVLEYPGLRIDLRRMTVTVREELVTLLPKDIKLLTTLASHPNQVLHTEQLYRLAWRDESNFSKDTVKVHISKLRKKIEENPSSPKFILTVGSLGYKFNPYGALEPV